MQVMESEISEIERLGNLIARAQTDMSAFAQARQDRIYHLLIETGATQSELADALDVSPAAIQQAVRAARSRPLRRLEFDSLDVQGRWARELRLRAGLDRREAAQHSGLPASWIRRVEAGEPTEAPGYLPKLFAFYGATAATFIVED